MPFNIQLNILDQTDSTNLYAINQIRDNMAGDGQAWMALTQTHGKGRNKNTWESEKGKSIAISLALNMQNKNVAPAYGLSMATALACLQTFKIYTTNVAIKWPNDIMLGNKKSGGILIDNIWLGNNWQWAVIGIGLNINQKTFNPTLKQATSLIKHTKTKAPYDIIIIAQQLLANLKTNISLLLSDAGEVYAQYNKAIYKHLLPIKYFHIDAVKTGKIIAVNPNGTILINNKGTHLYQLDDIKILY
jgi:BirA family transcriptional regulator, biotin operon repressor / biotin---[acetyl-CoA-carboxylase] ligase